MGKSIVVGTQLKPYTMDGKAGITKYIFVESSGVEGVRGISAEKYKVTDKTIITGNATAFEELFEKEVELRTVYGKNGLMLTAVIVK